ncbi:MAG: hypothetical protein DRP55_00150, partial [Spirochaetes bacterium]
FLLISSSLANESVKIKKIDDHSITFLFSSLPESSLGKMMEVEVRDLDGNILSSMKILINNKTIWADLPAKLDKKNLANYFINYFWEGEKEKTFSLFFLKDKLETLLVEPKAYFIGSKAGLRVIVRNHSTSQFVKDAKVTIKLNDTPLFEGRTDEKGTLSPYFKIPSNLKEGFYNLNVNVETPFDTDNVNKRIYLKEGIKILLSTDKPIYQPGQTIHIRMLAIDKAIFSPVKERAAQIEITDSKGNRVFLKKGKLNKFGIFFADFILAEELNLGRYSVKAKVGRVEQKKTITVKRYKLPKFKIEFSTDKNYYQPSEILNAKIKAEYIFGKPVTNGKIKIELLTFDVKFRKFAKITAKTNKDGLFEFSQRLPEYFTGQPLEKGKAFILVDIRVTDKAGHTEKLSKKIPVVSNIIYFNAIPEAGILIPNIENRIYILTTYPDGIPAKTRFMISFLTKKGKIFPDKLIETDETGFATIKIVPKGNSIKLKIDGKDEKGSRFFLVKKLKIKQKMEEALILRTNKVIATVGDRLDIEILTTKKVGTAYLDLIKNSQTLLTYAFPIVNGKATYSTTLPLEAKGMLILNGYILTRNGNIIKDSRVIMVKPASNLKISIKPNKDVYRPGGPASIRFLVTDEKGKAKVAALGVSIVDEAVFALSEMQPGMERIYFLLEKEIAKPRFEIHGFSLDNILSPSMPKVIDKEKISRILFSSLKTKEDMMITNTYIMEEKGKSYENLMVKRLKGKILRMHKALLRFYSEIKKKGKLSFPTINWESNHPVTLKFLVEEEFLTPKDIIDPFGNPFHIKGKWDRIMLQYKNLQFVSPGPDKTMKTADDIIISPYIYLVKGRRWPFGRMMLKKIVPAPHLEGRNLLSMSVEGVKEEKEAGKGKKVKIREYFPETLYYNPLIVTNEMGKASLTLNMADSITTWRLSTLANSADGLLGSTSYQLRVFQDFFIDIDLPLELIQNDEISIPIAIYNYLKKPQKVRLEIKKEDWFVLKDKPIKEIKLKPNEVTSIYFTIKAKKIGLFNLTVTAIGDRISDGIKRAIKVVPDGKKIEVVRSGRLKRRIIENIAIPNMAISDASKIFVRIYPGIFSQVVEGMDKLLRMPFGCFEQTSSVTYPNILALSYMITTKKITPEIEMKAKGYINLGYQRLLSFEVPGGGFEWFGRAPAHPILTAYGLMEFYDMSKVYDIDEEIITRTQKWLLKKQEKDGSFSPVAKGIREGAINKFTKDRLRTTAYIIWALSYTKYKGPELAKGINYIKDHLKDIKDNYTLALITNAFVNTYPDSPDTKKVIDMLISNRIEKKGMVYWKLKGGTATYGRGISGRIETTAIAAQAILKYGGYPNIITKIINFIIKNKDPNGTWYSTQATVQALKALLSSIEEGKEKIKGIIIAKINNKKASTIKLEAEEAEIVHIIDMKPFTKKGKNKIELIFKGEGNLYYQIIGRYYIPHRLVRKKVPPLVIQIDFDRTNLKKDDIIKENVKIENRLKRDVKMVIIDLGIPPGFLVIDDDLKAMVKNKKIERYSKTGRQVIIYLREIKAKKRIELTLRLKAKYPVKAKSPISTVYEYYKPEQRSYAKEVLLTVTK